MKDEKKINKVIEIENNDILPNRFQPRKYFDEEEILQLSESIKEHGVINPIIVRKLGDKYELVAGERRYKANILAGNDSIPSIVMDINDKESSEIAIVENIQRKDLNSIEEAISYKRSLDIGLMTQEQLAKKMGKSQSYIANKIRLLKLSDEVQEALMKKQISDRHARSLLKLDSLNKQNELLKKIINERLTVRKTDEEIEKMNNNINSVNGTLNQEILNPSIETMVNPNNVINGGPQVIENSINNNLKPMGNNYSPLNENNNMINNNINSEVEKEMVIPVMPNNSISDIDISDIYQNNNVSNDSVKFSNMDNNPSTNFAPKTSPIEETITPIIDISSTQDSLQSNNNINEYENVNNNNLKTNLNEFNLDNNYINTISNISDTISLNSSNNNFDLNSNPMENQINNNPSNQIENDLINNNPSNQIKNDLINNKMENKENFEQINNNNRVDNTNNSINSLFNFSPIIDTTKNDSSEVSKDSINNISNQETMIAESKPEPIIVNDYNQQYDPIMPDKENNTPTIDFKSIINLIRKCSSAIENSGYKIETEEYNLDNLYQVVFKIEKK